MVGYDPGGMGKHGVAVLRVQPKGDRWRSADLRVITAQTLTEVVTWVTDTCRDGRIIAAGTDTLTEWNSGPGGWRPADRWLINEYPPPRLGASLHPQACTAPW